MNKEKNKVISLFALTLFCLLLNMKVGAFVFGVLAIIKGARYMQDPDRRLKDRIREDALTWNAYIPESFLIKNKLFAVYKKIEAKEKREPIFISSFSIVLDEFWQETLNFESEREWLESLAYLERNIPKGIVNKGALTEALSDLQNLNLQLEKATVEVRK